MSRKPCKYHCDYGDGQYCQYDGECCLNSSKPPLGCSPYYVNISARICELCDAIKRHSTEKGFHNKILLWAKEIIYLNEMDRSLKHDEKQRTWVENRDGTLKEI